MTRTATIKRTTTETDVSVTLDLDGTGAASINTGVGFFDHLLEALAKHSLIDLTITTVGDLHIDDHHTVEDTMLGIGEALNTAVGDGTGITRYGDAVIPMDEAIARCALDFGGRAYAVLNIPFRGEAIGNLSTQNIPHCLEALAQTAGITLHLQAEGRNDHHIAEASFKALARALRAAVAIDPRRPNVIASTKGVF